MNTKEHIFTVSSLSDFINERIVEHIGKVWVIGEITGLQEHPSGIYFSLKDKEDGSVINCYIYPRIYQRLGIRFEDGMEVKAHGIAQIYKGKGRLSFVISQLLLAGEGSLKKSYELLKKQLFVEGLFNQKRPLPEYIVTIGIITSKTGAVINDFRKNLLKRGFKIFLKDVRVEGQKAVTDIVEAIKLFNQKMIGIDILIVMRGGGSLEDLQAFNNELVARELFASRIPTISAIGHDRDLPISNLVSDTATSTPTAAAMLINQSWLDTEHNIVMLQKSIMNNFSNIINEQRVLIQNISKNIKHIFAIHIEKSKQEIAYQEKYLINVDPQRQLQRGYSIVLDNKNKVIKDAKKTKVGDNITIQLHRGKIISKITTVNK